MDVGIIAIVVGLGGVIVLFINLFLRTNKKLFLVSNELKFFKKEKEYYDEAMIMISLKNNRVIFANESAKDLFSLNDENESLGISKKVQLRVHDDMPKDFFDVIYTLDNPSESNFKLENVSLILSGQEKKVNIFIDKTTLDTEETLTCVIDAVKESANVVSDTRKNGAIDFLTGLPTQFVALADINTFVIESKKKSESFGLFLLGIDHFKEIQSTMGLGYTNQLLKKLSTYFIDHPDENTTVYRMDSDKFLFLIHGLDEDGLARNIAKEFIIKVNTIHNEHKDVRLSSSIGITMYPRDGENATKLINNLYATLGRAQRESESNIALFTTEHQIIREDELQMKEDIRKGLIKSEFLLYYQPIFDLAGEQMIGAEALLRWKHPTHGLIAADKFLDVAEKSGLIVDLGEYVFNEAIQQRERCGLGAREDFQITINLSLKEMDVDKLLPRLEVLFDKYNVSKHSINLDISESIAMGNIDKTVNDFKLFKDFGLSLALDHFGAGYSSFKYLSMLPVDTIKIDRSLIFDLTLNLKHQTIVKAMIELAHTLGYKVVAEGVETSQEASILAALHCDYAQGYLYSRPLPYNEFEELLS